jgi:hypothetical protein
MDCIAPEEVREGDLLSYSEGRASQQVKEHIARCPFCAAEAAALAEVDRVLTAVLYRASCPATEVLVQYQAGLLRAHERRQVERHVQVCPLCASELRRLSALDDPRHSLWEEMRRAARAIVEAARAQPPPHLAVAVRGGWFTPRLYRAGELDIVLSSEAPQPPRDLWRLRARVTRGGVAAAELARSTVRLVQEDRVVASQPVDDLGYFSFGDLTAGQYDLWMEGPEADVVVREVAVGVQEGSER